MAPFLSLRQLPYSLVLLLSLSSPSCALSAHSPQDLLAYPKYAVVLSDQVLLNDSAAALLEESKRDDAESDDPDGSTPSAVHILRTPAGQAFLCSVPSAVDKPSKRPMAEDMTTRRQERERGLERGLALLEPMKGGCLYQKQGWFTYSFCYGQDIRQFHEIRLAGSPGPSEDPNTDSYTLGQSPSPVPIASHPKYGSGSSVATTQRIPSTLGGGNEMGFGWEEGGRYLSQKWEGGTICDKTGMPRNVEVQFHCSTQSTDRILLIREVAICSYVLLIHTPRLCVEPIFLEGHDSSQEPPATIQCQPIVKKIREAVDPPLPPPVPPPSPALHPEILQDSESVPAEVGSGAGQDGDILSVEFIDLGSTEGLDLSQAEGSLAAAFPGLDTVTLVYDPDTGEITSAETADGHSLFDSDGTLITTERTLEDGEKKDEAVAVKDLEELVRIMHQSISDALRQHASRDGVRDTPPSSDDPDQRDHLVTNGGVEVDGITGLLEAINRGVAKGVQAKEGGLENLEVAALKVQEQRAVGKNLGSEEHSKLTEMFEKNYNEGEEVEGEKAERTAPPRDEL